MSRYDPANSYAKLNGFFSTTYDHMRQAFTPAASNLELAVQGAYQPVLQENPGVMYVGRGPQRPTYHSSRHSPGCSPLAPIQKLIYDASRLLGYNKTPAEKAHERNLRLQRQAQKAREDRQRNAERQKAKARNRPRR